MQVSELKLATQNVKALGSDAVEEVGTFTLKPKGQQPQEVAGKYVVIWRKVGGEWKIATDILEHQQVERPEGLLRVGG